MAVFPPICDFGWIAPGFFGFNAASGLQYRGRLDASREVAGPPDVRRGVFEAIKRVTEAEQGPRAQTPSMRCSIKWRTA